MPERATTATPMIAVTPPLRVRAQAMGGGLVPVGIVAAAGAGALALAARRVRNDEGREIS